MRSSRRCRTGRGCAGDEAAGGQRPGQQGRVVDFAGGRQGLLGLLHTYAVPGVEHGFIGERPGAHRGRYLEVVGEGNVEPRSPLADGPRLHSGRSDDASAKAGSMSALSRLHPKALRRLSISISACFETSLIVAACRCVERGCQ
jgi:hypothetical protein